MWLVTHTSAPRPLAAWLTLINTLIVVFLQVRAARGADTVPGASRLQRWTFMVIAGACVITGFSHGVPGWSAGLILAAAVVLFTFGEIWGEAARWGLRYELAPGKLQGQYGAAFAIGDAVALIVGPTLVTAVPDRLGLAGWLLLTALFLVALALVGPPCSGPFAPGRSRPTRPDPAGAARHSPDLTHGIAPGHPPSPPPGPGPAERWT